MANTSETNYDTIFGKMAMDQGLCTDDELKKSVEELKKRHQTNPIMLNELMVSLGYLTKNQAQRLEKTIRESKTLAHQIPGYKILGKLGAGAMAIVYKGQQLSLNRPVAIKVLPKRFTQNPEYVERFYKEGRAAAKLNHNNIVQAFDVGEAGGYHYFVMEYVEGKTLYDDLAAGKIYSEQDALDIIIQIARALAHAHSKGLIHRDIKPKNIMIDPQSVAKLADMGLARETTDVEAAQTEAGKAYGTPYYISPEQIRGEVDIDGRADIYGLGATFYHLVTGRVPYMADNPAEVMRKHLKEALIPPDHINTSLSAGVSEVIETMLAKRKEDRYSNAKELLQDLEAIRSGQAPIQAHKRMDVSVLKQLQAGEDVEEEYQEEEYSEDPALMRYRMAVIILGMAMAVAVVVIILLLMKHRG